MKRFKTEMRTATVLKAPLGSRHNNASGFKCFAWPCFHNLSSCQGGSRLVSYGLPSLREPWRPSFFFSLSFFYSTLCIMSFYCQHSGPIDGRCDWWGVALTDSPTACIVFVTLISKNSRLKRQPKRFSLFTRQWPKLLSIHTVQTYCVRALALVKSELIFWSR